MGITYSELCTELFFCENISKLKKMTEMQFKLYFYNMYLDSSDIYIL